MKRLDALNHLVCQDAKCDYRPSLCTMLDAQQNEFTCFCPMSPRRFIRLKYKTANDSILYDDFSPESLSIFRAVCPQVAKSYQKRFLECLYLFLLTMSQYGYECQIRKKGYYSKYLNLNDSLVRNELKHLQ